MTGSLGVIVPTRFRPQTLATALHSIQRQLGVNINEIIVSENSSDTASEIICKELADARIRFVRQQPECGPQEHLVRLFQLAASDWLAILHDDDWWLPGHLANISNIISTGPADLAAVAAHVIYVSGENNTRVHGWGTELPLHLAKHRPVALECVKLEYAEMLSLCRVYTPLHFSALCVRREVALYTSSALLRTSWYNADRLWFPSIAARGPILFDPLPSVLVRWHQGNWAAGQTAATREAEFLEGCRQIDEEAISVGHDISAFWRIHLRGISKTERQMLAPMFARAYPAGNVEIGSEFPRLGIFVRSKRFALHLGRRLLQHLSLE